jgi:acetyl-CoA C-acetyltransferase
LQVANMVVDQAAAVILCSLGTARALGIAEERLVYPHAASEAVVVRYLSERETLDAEPPQGIVGRRALELAGAEAAQMAHLDFYSCFPVAVQLAAEALGIEPGRPLTVTGGLTFAGGPFNSYVLHAIATLMERLRGDPGSRGLVTSVGGFFSKHAAGVYGSQPPQAGFRWEDCGDAVRALPGRSYVADFCGDAELETYTVSYPGEGAPRAIAACRTSDGARCWATSDDPELLSQLQAEDLCERAVAVDGERRLSLR